MTADELSTELCNAMHHKLYEMESFRMSRFDFASAVYAAAASLVCGRLNLSNEEVKDVFTAIGKSIEINVIKVYNHD